MTVPGGPLEQLVEDVVSASAAALRGLTARQTLLTTRSKDISV